MIKQEISGQIINPTKDGYVFDSVGDRTVDEEIDTPPAYWSTNKDGSGDKYYSIKDDAYKVAIVDYTDDSYNQQAMTLKENITLYAQYRKPSFELMSYGSTAGVDDSGNLYYNPSSNPLVDLINSSGATKVWFTDKVATEVSGPNVETIDVSYKQEGGVVAWVYTNGNQKTVMVSTQKSGQKIIAPKDMSYLLFNCNSSFTTVLSENLSLRQTQNMTTSFYSATDITIANTNITNLTKTSSTNPTSGTFLNATSLQFKNVKFGNRSTKNDSILDGGLQSATNLESLSIDNCDFSLVNTLACIFDNMTALKYISIRNSDLSTIMQSDNILGTSSPAPIENVIISGKNLSLAGYNSFLVFSNCTMPEDATFMFAKSKIKDFELDDSATWSLTDMYGMFEDATNLTTVNFGKADTSKVGRMTSLFEDCTALTSLNISNFVTNKVTDMSKMFNYCKSLASIDVAGLDTSNVTNMSNMFTHCDSITSLDVTHFNTEKVTNMDSMFSVTNDDFPEPDTPVTTVKVPNLISTVTFFKLFCVA